MKRILTYTALFLALASVLALASGCIHVSIGSPTVKLRGGMETLNESLSVSRGCRVELDNMSFLEDGGVVIRIRYGEEANVTGSVPEDIFDHGFKVTADNGVLRIAPRKHISIDAERFELTVTAPFDEVVLSGGYPIAIDAAGAKELSLEVNGAASGTVENLAVGELEAEFSGAGAFAFTGSAEEAEISIKGAGDIDAAGLIAKRLEAEVAGAGDMVVSVTNSLEAKISGVGNIEYYGDPSVSQQIGGIGTVTQRSETLPGE